MNIFMTGCCSSFGAYIREKLLEQGHIVFGVGLNGPNIFSDFSLHTQGSYNFQRFETMADVIWEEALEHFEDFSDDPIHCLINNAAITRIDFTSNHSLQDFVNVLNVDLVVPFLFMKKMVQQVEEIKRAGILKDDDLFKIVNTTSMGARFALRASHGYCTAKAGLEHLTRVIAKETAGNIPLAAVCIAPNGVEGGGMTDYTLQRVCETRGWTREFAEEYNKNTPLGRLMTFDEVWAMFNFAVNDMPQFYTGNVFTCPGGGGF